MKQKLFVCSLTLGAVLLSGCGRKEVVAEDPPSVWQGDYAAAMKQAADENKYVLVSISGLEWCSWCKALEREVFSQPEFTDYAKQNLVCILLDFDSSGKATNAEFAQQHEALLQRFHIQGFPTVLIMNPQGKIIERDGYQRGGATHYVDFIKTVIANHPM